MEDGPNGAIEAPEHVSNGVVSPMMANFPEEAPAKEEVKVNGDAEQISECSSESDALVIDEAPNKKKPVESSPPAEVIPHFNPYFNESLFELSQQAQTVHKHRRLRNKNNPKLREYAQYLGLQPTVQFKCSRCGRAGFESLTTLNEHIVQCTDEPSAEPQISENSASSFKLTRKVFLCSACGTYYENWNLYLHMIEVHRRYLCLYCLGMFSVLDDLCLHIQSRHNLEPGYKDSLDDFFNTYSEPCYIVCCECNKLFNEQENFFYHSCAGRDKNKAQKGAKPKQLIRPEDHVTGETLVNGSRDACPSIDKDLVGEESDRQVDAPVIDEEIVYSTDEELDFRGFTEAGDPVFKNHPPELEPEVEQEPEEDAQKSEEVIEEEMEVEEPVETRKVPKLSLKLKLGSFPQIEQLESVEPEEAENENLEEPQQTEDAEKEEADEKDEPQEPEMKIAGADTSIVELELEQPLDKFDIRILLQKCLNATAPVCIYCNHARKIAVNGKELGLHAIGEHRFSAVVHSITAEELIPESFVTRIKDSLSELDRVFFSLESSPSDEAVTFSHVFECFQCRYSTSVHKELYLHNRKSHAKNLLLCIMCKSNFYSYSELICHLCPGVYILDYDVAFRCCMCVGDDLPSAFRLMVHLRKRHHVCDVCLEMCHDQYRLSNHVWKHKLHHFCYRCGIAYRNKPDITRHLFWKHGTESMLCKKCLQKKWPHVYHFCVPPTSFLCEECNLTFSKAVCLKVHKRIHTDEKPHPCTVDDCKEKFISKKLLAKHEAKHREPPEEKIESAEPKEEEKLKPEEDEAKEEKTEPVKPKVDVYDLPELNLSESDSSDSEDEAAKAKVEDEGEKVKDVEEEKPKELEAEGEVVEETVVETTVVEDAPQTNEVVLENIWDDFKNYQANKEKFDNMFSEADKSEQPETPAVVENEPLTLEMALRDHDYCIDPDNKPDISFTEVKPDLSQSVDHDYCTAKKDPVASPKNVPEEKPDEKAKKKDSSSSDSSSDSDSSSCSCGPNCSCSSSSGSSSSSSDSSDSDSSTEEGRKRQQLRRDKRRQRKTKEKNPAAEVKVDVGVSEVPSIEMPISESDLETTESETDEEFYDKQPQKLAKKILEEKRNQLLAGIDQANGSLLDNSRAATPNMPEEDPPKKKKSKSKKKKKKKSERREMEKAAALAAPPYYQYYQPPTVAPLTLTLSRNSPIPSPSAKLLSTPVFPKADPDTSREEDGLRASKRRRVPNKFYGYSSDEEDEKLNTPKWRKTDLQVPPQHSSMMVPPLTIKTTPQMPPYRPAYQNKEPPSRKMPAIKLKTKLEDVESEVESNDSSSESRNMLQVNPDALYCYCKCPYDEVSEMIGCDARDCSIEWFHFECVGIMVPPKGHWYCPECRKKRQQKRESLKLKAKTS